ncbi:hypothetical protein PoB_007044100 [Plakobranchus ocellatus]|uniref:PH domain-containing protein n=1 Tax=Plakobranchus ocellatus TaxID=259542 RepID=A0AAV4DJA3_9GAST|nr:hypothetical protein PoB_007044100 [Plakobranchus ocellatus]
MLWFLNSEYLSRTAARLNGQGGQFPTRLAGASACTTSTMPKDAAAGLLAYRSYSLSNLGPLQRRVINRQKAKGTRWAVIRESTVLYYSSDK